jgi:hypothetical protein
VAVYPYLKPYAMLSNHQLLAECTAAGLPVVDVQTVGDEAQTVNVVTSRDLVPAEKMTLDCVVAAPAGGRRRPRSVFAIYADLTDPAKLTAAQADAVIADLQLTSLAGKWTGLLPPQDAPAAALRWAAVNLNGATANEKRQAAAWVAAMWCQQHPKYLVNPTFHPSLAGVVIPGDEIDPG